MSATPWTATGSRIGDADHLTLVDGGSFLVSARSGELTVGGVEGLFVFDTRVLSRWRVEIDGAPLEVLVSVPQGPFGMTLVAQPRMATTHDSPLLVLRRLQVGRGLHDDIMVRSHAAEEVELTIRLSFDADFASVFDVKGGSVQDLPPARRHLDDDRICLVLDPGPGQRQLATVVRFLPRPDQVGPDHVTWRVRLAPRAELRLCAEVGVEVDGSGWSRPYAAATPMS